MAEKVEAKERRILVAVDEGEESMYALSWCISNLVSDSVTSGDTLVLLYVRPPRLVYPAIDGTGYLFSSDIMASMEKYSMDIANALIDKARSACKHVKNVKVEAKVEHGDPREVICESVEKYKAHVLVMGSHGYGLFKRALLGSVSSHCAQSVKCPVLIVKKPKH